MRTSSKLNMAGMAAVIAIATLGSGTGNVFGSRSRASAAPRRRPYQPAMKTTSDREIAAWNEAIEAKRMAKKARK